jgi:hypothetical protein
VICAVAHAAVAAPGTPALQRARQAWEEGELDQAEHAYQEALEKGGLDRAATLECFVHLGAARSVLGNRAGALTAFRMALLVDDAFTVPPEAGKKAVAMAEAARRQPSRVGSLHLTLSVPSEAPSGEPFAVNAMLDAAQAALVARLSLHVNDKTTHKTFDHDEPADAVVRFHVPASMTLPNATLHIEVDALDTHDNQLAFAEDHVGVRPTPIAETHHAKDELRQSHAGFWSTPWPYVIGGALLVAGGVTTGYFLLKPPDQVSIGPAQLQTH